MSSFHGSGESIAENISAPFHFEMKIGSGFSSIIPGALVVVADSCSAFPRPALYYSECEGGAWRCPAVAGIAEAGARAAAGWRVLNNVRLSVDLIISHAK